MKKLLLLLGVCVLWALGTSNTNAQITITHSSSQTISSGAVACNTTVTGLSVDNFYSRSFVLSGFGVTGTFNVDTVEFGVESLVTANGSHPITVTLSTTSTAYPGGTLTQLAQSTVSVNDTTLAIIPVPITAAVPPGSELVVSVDFVADTLNNPSTFFIGSNGLGQTAPSYIVAPGCGITTPTTFAAIGNPNVHIVINVKGSQTGGVATDAALIASTPNEYTLIPDPQQLASNPATASVQNLGSSTIASGNVNTNIYLAPNFTTPVQTLTGSFSNLATGNTTNVTLTNYTPLAVGNYVFEHIVTVAGDGNANNDTLYTSLGITGNEYARDNGSPTNSVGLGAGASGTIGNTFQVNTGAQLDSVLFFIAPGPTALGDTVRVLISNVVAGVPQNTYIGGSADYILTPADTSSNGTILVLPVTANGGGPLNLTAGNYLVAVEETFTMPNMGIQCTPEIYTSQTVYANINGGAYAELTSLVTGGFPFTPVIRPYLNTAQVCAVTSSVAVTDETCTGANGSATVTASGGAAPYTYNWSTGGSAASISNLAAGTYYVTVTDNAGCAVSDSAVVGTNNITVNSSGSSTDETCTSAGTATITPSSGTAPYTYMWSDGQMTATATGLTGGTYNVTITDDNGCTGTASVVVNSTAVTIAASTTSTDASCGASDGSATVTPSNGASPYVYIWSDNQTTQTANNLPAGSYDVTVTDNNGCAGVFNVVVSNPNAPTASASSTDINCFGDTDGTVSSTATGGTGSYSYLWSANAGSATTANVSGLGAGTYTVTITDSLSCAAVATTTISGPASGITVTTSSTDATIAGAADGTATANVTGGTAPYTYAWSNGQNTATATGLSVGQYTVSVTDDNGCTSVQTVLVNDGPVGVLTTSNLVYVNVYPNPTRGQATLEVRLGEVSDLTIEIVNVAGQVVQRTLANGVIDQRFEVNMNDWPSGMYLIRVTSDNATSTHRIIKQ